MNSRKTLNPIAVRPTFKIDQIIAGDDSSSNFNSPHFMSPHIHPDTR